MDFLYSIVQFHYTINHYLPSHYEAQLQKTIPYLSADEVKERAKSNLEKIGAIYEYKD